MERLPFIDHDKLLRIGPSLGRETLRALLNESYKLEQTDELEESQEFIRSLVD